MACGVCVMSALGAEWLVFMAFASDAHYPHTHTGKPKAYNGSDWHFWSFSLGNNRFDKYRCILRRNSKATAYLRLLVRFFFVFELRTLHTHSTDTETTCHATLASDTSTYIECLSPGCNIYNRPRFTWHNDRNDQSLEHGPQRP